MLARPLASETVVERAVWRLEVLGRGERGRGPEPCAETVGEEIVGAHGAYR
jgi:hypothetical protein